VTYALGIDLGTTFTAAATWRDGHTEIASLGSRAASIPSVVLLRQDETFLTGETANRRALTEPHRVAREFKRRLGDPTPILLGGVPYSAEALMARLLRSVIDEVATREGGPPSSICVSHPANWGPYKTDLLRQAVRIADLEQPVALTTEPEAAAVFYAQQQRVDRGAVVAVYDLGGGTFDAAVLRKTGTGFEILGQPEGIERLGGIDFDAAVFSHVSRALGGKLAELDEDDPTAIAAVARLREECVEAKEALSSDTDATIPVLLPNISTEIRLTRGELEAMVRPALGDTIEALKRALRSAGVTPEQLHSVLLVGGSSRMPIVAQMVGAELGRPVAVDAHPKHAVALGAAWLASGSAATAPAPASQPAPAPQPAPRPAPAPAEDMMSTEVIRPVRAEAGPPVPPPRASAAKVYTSGSKPHRGVLVIAGGIALAVLAAGGVALAARGGGRDTPETGGTGNQAKTQSTPSATPSPSIPPDEQCTDEIKQNTRWVCLTKATLDGERIVIEYEAEFADASPTINGGFHLHIYGGDGTTPADETMGIQSSSPGKWYVEDKNPSIRRVTGRDFRTAIGDAPKVCARIATAAHALVPDANGTFKTGNCVPIKRVRAGAARPGPSLPKRASNGGSASTGRHGSSHTANTHGSSATPTPSPDASGTPTPSPTSCPPHHAKWPGSPCPTPTASPTAASGQDQAPQA
jgi:actin-like ATPase involved in cell morphogenesis